MSKIMISRLGTIFFLFHLCFLNSYASENLNSGLELNEIKKQIRDLCNENKRICKDREAFRPYKPNYVIWQSTDQDDDALEGRYSFRHVMNYRDCKTAHKYKEDIEDIEVAKATLKCLEKYPQRSEFFLTYSGKFDFYMGTRDSGPVVNRISNPAVHWRQYQNNKLLLPLLKMQYTEVSLQHRSNGQVRDADERLNAPGSANDGRLIAQLEYEKNRNNNEYFDTISRGANYLSVEARFQLGDSTLSKDDCKDNFKCIDTWFSLKPIYFDHDSNVTWGKYADKDVEIADFDRATLIMSTEFRPSWKYDWFKKHLPKAELGFEWTIGDELFDTDSIDVNAQISVVIMNIVLPLYVRYHSGPMNNLSDYTRSQEAIGVGFKFRTLKEFYQ